MKKNLLFFSFIGMLLSYIVLFIVDLKLQSGNLNFGIICFELAGNIKTSNDIIKVWIENNNLNLAAFSIGFDYLFIFFYVSFLVLWTAVMADRFYSKHAFAFAKIIMTITILAGIFDMTENYSLMQVLSNNNDYDWSGIAFYFASAKFIILIIAILYNLVISLIRWFTPFKRAI